MAYRRIRLLSLILATPLLGAVVGNGIQAHLNAKIHWEIQQKIPDVDEKWLADITLDRSCQTPEFQLSDICGTYGNLGWLIKASVGAGIAGLVLLTSIWFAGIIARNRRGVLLYAFKRGLSCTAASLIALIVLNAAIAIAAIYYAESTILRRLHFGIIGAIGLGAFGGIIVISKNVLDMIEEARTTVIGYPLTHDDAPHLWNHINEIADRLGALRPANLVVGLQPTFFATEATVICLSSILSGRTLYCSLPVCRILSKNEFSAVIAHELSHFQGLDTAFSKSFYPIYQGTRSAIISLRLSGGMGWKSVALIPAIEIFTYFYDCFAVAESQISRNRELAADQFGANFHGPINMATALVKIHAFATVWDRLRAEIDAAVQDRKKISNVSRTFGEAAAHFASPDLLIGIADTQLSHPTDSHPPLAIRLKSLSVALQDVAEASLTTDPVDPAINLVSEPEKREEYISEAFHLVVARQIGVDLESAPLSPTEVSLRPSTDLVYHICPHCRTFQRSYMKVCSKCGRRIRM